MINLSITVMIPAYNESAGIRDSIEGLMRQSVSPDKILVIDDCSTDDTAAIASEYDVVIVSPPKNLGSKAKAQNFGLNFCDTDLVLPVDGDTILSTNYIEKIKQPFADDNVSVAAGCVLTQFTNTIWERGRNIEYLFGFHWYRPVQSMANSPTVCSGCCTAFRTDRVKDFGGFPERTMVEDIDMTWSQQIMGHRAVYVHDAVAYAAEPDSAKYLSKQLWRWKSGWFQNVRLHWRELLSKKKMLAFWVALSLIDIVVSPLVMALPVVMYVLGTSIVKIIVWWAASELVTLFPPVFYGCWKRKISVLKAISWYPSWYVLKLFNFYYDWKAFVTEIILVPAGLAQGLSVYERGKA